MGRIRIMGDDWQNCYLNQYPESKDRKNQVLRDLSSYIRNNIDTLKKEDLITIDCDDHSTAFEQFIVYGFGDNKGWVFLVYLGGGS